MWINPPVVSLWTACIRTTTSLSWDIFSSVVTVNFTDLALIYWGIIFYNSYLIRHCTTHYFDGEWHHADLWQRLQPQCNRNANCFWQRRSQSLSYTSRPAFIHVHCAESVDYHWWSWKQCLSDADHYFYKSTATSDYRSKWDCHSMWKCGRCYLKCCTDKPSCYPSLWKTGKCHIQWFHKCW